MKMINYESIYLYLRMMGGNSQLAGL